MMKNLLVLVSFLGLAACGDNLSGLRPDAREQTDSGPMIDGPPGQPDANTTPDAVVSSVVVTPDCTGINAADIDIELRAPAITGFRIMGDTVDNPDLNINVGDIIAFQTMMVHNFASAPTVPAAHEFTSGVPGNHRACLTFTAAFTGTYQCDMHPTTMTGDITVAP